MSILSLGSRRAAARTEAEQRQIDAATSNLALYHFTTCPYCLRVRWALRRLGIRLDLRSIRKDRGHFDDLVAGGGKKQVPCLRIEESGGAEPVVRWMYESSDIIRYLKQQFA